MEQRTLDLLALGLCTTDARLKLTGRPNRAFHRLFGPLEAGADLSATVFAAWSDAQKALLREAVSRALSEPEPGLRPWQGPGTGELIILGPTRADMRYCRISLGRLGEGPEAPVLLQFRDVTDERRLVDDQERQRRQWDDQNQRVKQLLGRDRPEVQDFVSLFSFTVESAARVVRQWSAEGCVDGAPGTLLAEMGRFRARAEALGFTAAADRAGRMETSLRAVWEEGLELERHLQVVGDYEALAEEKRQFERVVGRIGDLTPAEPPRRDPAELEALLKQTVGRTCAAAGKEAAFRFVSHLGPVDHGRFEALRKGLVPLVQNAVTHGIELAEVRAAVGKPIPGRIEVRLTAEGEGFRLVVRDDGRGIDWAALRTRLEARSVLAPGASDEVLARQLLVGGVGSGLAEVRRALVKDLAGRISLRSAAGQGVQIEVTVP